MHIVFLDLLAPKSSLSQCMYLLPSLCSMFQIDDLDPTSYDLPGEYLVSLLKVTRHSKVHLVSIWPPR
jgi:hypothetical protein